MARQRRPPTRSGLLPEAAHLVLPRGIVADGFPSTQRVCERIGIVFDPWQCDLNRAILAKARGGLYAADTVLLSIPRQVGKTFDVGGVVFADSIINPGTTTVWTAHRFKVARESFDSMRAWAKSPKLAPHIDYDDITTGAGNECIPFRNGSRIVFAARERGSIRGFTKVRRLVLDEGQILTDAALSDLVPTMNQAVNPQIILMCTPPKPSDPGEVVSRLRDEALAGESTGVLYVEMSAPPGSAADDRSAWRKANASYPKRTPARAILRMRKVLSPEDFLREALGIWDTAGRKFSADQWAACADPLSVIASRVALAIAVESGGVMASIAAAGMRPDGLLHGEMAERRPGTAWLVAEAVAMAQRQDACVLVMKGGSEAPGFEKELISLGFSTKPQPGKRLLQIVGPAENAQACVALAEDVKNGRFRHLGQGPLTEAADAAGTRPVSESWVWAQKNPAGISPLEAVTLARHGFMTHGVSASAFFAARR